MGFGNGYSVRRDRGGKRFSNDMVAHVWNAQSAESGQSGNGNFFFNGRSLWSYGSHFLVGFIMPDGVALLNADSYSVSTSGHQSDARGACRNRTSYYVPALTKLESTLSALARGFGSADSKRRHVRAVREFLIEHPNAEAGAVAYLAGVFGLARSLPAIQKESERRKAKAKRDDAKGKRDFAKREALRLADYTDSEFRAAIARGLNAWSPHDLDRLKLALYHAKRAAKANGFSKRRLATLKAREARVREVLSEYAIRHDLARRRSDFASSVSSIRHALKNLEQFTGDSADTLRRRSQEFAAMGRAASQLKDSPRFPSATRFRLAKLQADAEREAEVTSAAYQEARTREYAEAERARAMEIAEYRQAWLAGEASGGRHFDSDHGGAALRVRGDDLETSHGASVPLAHAIKAFRFMKLIRERGESWARNGKTIRVGHFQIDRIAPSGDFKAGCHDIRWLEVERIAAALGLLDVAPSAEAEERSAAA